MIKEKMVRFRIEPYIYEALLQMMLDLLVLAMVLVVLTLTNFPSLVCVVVAMGYLVVALVFHYKVAIQAIIDKHAQDYTTEIVSIKSFNDEYSFSGDRLGHSNIRFFYPKDMQVRKYKITTMSDNGKEKKLRSVISFKRLLKFMMLDKQQVEYLQVTYLKRSKILLHVDLVEETIRFTGKRKKVIEKAIHYINMST
ncbi:MAG: hypothetical protein IJZ16_13370 [Clostridia bacterium]|nr:hypothetical protein [Clostridia bacterium]